MYPTFHNFDYLFVERVSYYFREPARGEVIVFRFPKNENDYFIKRIIGLPGERVIIEDGKISVLREAGNEPFFLHEEFPFTKDPFTEGNVAMTLGKDEYFVLGDNRAQSFDSRRWGPLTRREIIGKVLLRIWPPPKANAFFGEDYRYQLPTFSVNPL